MTMSDHAAATPRAVQVTRILGYFVFLVAFFLPACRQVATPGAGDPDVYKGYFCAWVTLINSLNGGSWRSKDFLAILSGWINPLMLLYVAFVFSPRLRRARRAIAVLVALFLIGTWTYFALAALAPLIGHFLWVAGIVLIMAGDLLPGPRRPIVAGRTLPNP